MKRLITTVLILFYASAFAGQSQPAPSTGIPSLDEAIKNFDSDARLLTSRDLDAACGKRENPGFVPGDFKGNGKRDYAVILKVGGTVDAIDENEGESQTYQQIKVDLVVFLSQEDGGFVPVILDELDVHSLPAPVYVETLKTGPVTGSDSDTPLVLRHTGIGVAFCGQFETVYYWDDDSNDFREIDISGDE